MIKTSISDKKCFEIWPTFSQRIFKCFRMEFNILWKQNGNKTITSDSCDGGRISAEFDFNVINHALSIYLVFKPILSINQKRWIFTHLPSTKLQTVFCIVLFDFFHLKIWGPETRHTPLHTFPIFGSPIFWCWCQSARGRLKGLKIGVDRFWSTLSMFLIKNTFYAFSRPWRCVVKKS